jgi:hypothetical protein
VLQRVALSILEPAPACVTCTTFSIPAHVAGGFLSLNVHGYACARAFPERRVLTQSSPPTSRRTVDGFCLPFFFTTLSACYRLDDRGCQKAWLVHLPHGIMPRMPTYSQVCTRAVPSDAFWTEDGFAFTCAGLRSPDSSR